MIPFNFKTDSLERINANELRKSGIYAIGVNPNNQNLPYNGGTLLVFFGISSWGVQLFVPYDTNQNKAYIRNYFSNSWSSWKEL